MVDDWRKCSRLTQSAALCALLDSPVPAVVSTVSPRDVPQSSVIWFERRQDEIAFFAEPHTLKIRNLRANPSIVLIVVDPTASLAPGTPAYVRLAGRAVVSDGEPGFPDRLAVAYGIESGYPWPLRDHLTVTVGVQRISGTR